MPSRCSVKTWQDVRKETHLANPQLASIIDDIDPSGKYDKWLHLESAFGDLILDNGKIPLTSCIYKQTQFDPNDFLGLTGLPLALVLTKECEVFVQNDKRTLPLNCVHTGQLFGLFEVFSPIVHSSIWSVSAGARSIFLLPKVSDAIANKRLQNILNFSSSTPKNLHNQWQFLKTLSAHDYDARHWTCETLLFPKNWVEKLNQRNLEPAWERLKLYLLGEAWEQMSFLRGEHSLNLLWDMLARIIKQTNTQASTYEISTLKHILTIAVGAYPGFSMKNFNDNCGPIERLQFLYKTHYGLQHAPIIMTPHILRPSKRNIPVYYSLSYPTSLEASFYAKESIRKIDSLERIKKISNHLIEHIKNNPKAQPYYNLFNTTEFNCFHYKNNLPHHLTHPTKSLPEFDPYIETENFRSSGAFTKSCVQIKKRSPICHFGDNQHLASIEP